MGFEMTVPDQLPGQILVGLFCIVAAWLILFSVRILFCAPYALLLAAQKRLLPYELDIAQLEILEFRCEHGEIGKIFLDFRIKNHGKPTTLKNWELSATGPNLSAHCLNLRGQYSIIKHKTAMEFL